MHSATETHRCEYPITARAILRTPGPKMANVNGPGRARCDRRKARFHSSHYGSAHRPPAYGSRCLSRTKFKPVALGWGGLQRSHAAPLCGACHAWAESAMRAVCTTRYLSLPCTVSPLRESCAAVHTWDRLCCDTAESCLCRRFRDSLGDRDAAMVYVTGGLLPRRVSNINETPSRPRRACHTVVSTTRGLSGETKRIEGRLRTRRTGPIKYTRSGLATYAPLPLHMCNECNTRPPVAAARCLSQNG